MRNFFVLFFISLSASAQEPLSLNECINQAIENSQTLKICSKESAILYSALKIIKTEHLPSLSATASADLNTNNINTSTLRNYGYDAGLSLVQTIWSGGRINSAKKAAELQITIQNQDNMRAVQSLEYQATTHYWNLVAYQKYLIIAEQYLQIVESLYRVVEIRFNDGYISKGDLLMVQTHLNEAQQGVISAKRLYSNALFSLNNTLGNLQVIEFSLIDTLSTPTNLPNTPEFQNILATRSDYQSSLNSIELAQRNTKVTRAQFNPQLWLTLSGNYGTPIPNLLADKTDLYGIAMLNFSTTIFEFGKRQKSVTQARQREQIAMLATESLEQEVFSELQIATNNLLQNFEECTLWENSLEAAQISLELSMYRYDQGAIPILDVLSSQIMWLTSYRSKVGAQWGYALALAELKYVSGTFF